jgi:hypothetical protein
MRSSANRQTNIELLGQINHINSTNIDDNKALAGGFSTARHGSANRGGSRRNDFSIYDLPEVILPKAICSSSL